MGERKHERKELKQKVRTHLQGHVEAWAISTRRRAAWSSSNAGPLYSCPKFSCSACSAGFIAWRSVVESSESKEKSDSDPSDSSLRSESESESFAEIPISLLLVTNGLLEKAAGVGGGGCGI